MPTLEVIHARLADSLLIFMAIAGLWCLIAALRGQGISSQTWGILAIGALLALAQAALGLMIYLGGERPARGIHILYGVVAVLGLPAYYALSHGRDDRRAAWTYAVLCLFLAGISLRAATTA